MTDDIDGGEPPPKKGPGVQINVPVSNSFAVLDDSSKRKKPPNSSYEEPDEPKTRRMPPITVPISKTGDNTHQTPDPVLVRSTILNKTTEFNIKHNEKGIIIFASNQSAHQKVTAALKSKSIYFYSHPLERNKSKRFVLYGLQRLELAAIQKLALDAGLQPEKVNIMTTNNPRFADQCNYLFQFSSSSTITLSSLKEIRALNHTIVQWAHYKPKRSGVSVCRNCCRFGHGADNCGMPAKCTICSGDHNFKNCKFLLKKHEGKFNQIHQKHINCANCGGNHTATYPNCPHRQNYIDSMPTRGRTRPTPSQGPRRPARSPPSNDDTNYPTPVFANPNYTPGGWVTAPRQPAAQVNQNHTGQDLFSIEECQQIMNDLFTSLRQCTCKQDQAKVIADYSFKYFCFFP